MSDHLQRRSRANARVSHVVFPILWGIGLLVFAGIMAVRMRLLVAARPAARLDRIPERIRRMVVYGLGQKKFLVGEQPSGIVHALVFWGFVVLMLQVITLFGRAFDAGWDIPGFGPDEPLGPPFFVARDLLEACVIVGVTYMLYRRLVLHTPRLFGIGRAEQRYRDAPHWEGVLILVLILLIMVGGLLYDAGRLVADDIHGNERDFAPLAALVGRGARWPRSPPRRAPSARSDGGCTASRSSCSCACCRCPSTSTSSPRSRTCSSPSSRRAAPSGRWRSPTCRPPRWPRWTPRPRAWSVSPRCRRSAGSRCSTPSRAPSAAAARRSARRPPAARRWRRGR